jgi:hypothetical protein
MARKLCAQLQIIFNDTREIISSPIYRAMREMHIIVKDVALMPLSHHHMIEGAEDVSKTILDITRSSMRVLQERISL